MFLLAALACLSWVPQQPTVEELRAAYDALRNGQPGEAKFEAAFPRLPELLASRSSTFVEGAAYVAGELGRSECAEALVDALRHENVGTGERSVGPTRCLLDALIRLEHAAPAEVLLARPEPDLATMLYLALSCEQEAEVAASSLARFVELGWSAEPAYWAAAIELTAARDPRIAAHWFGGATWELRIGVRDPGSNEEIQVTRGGGGWTTSHPMWPPRVQYEVKLPDSDGPLDGIEFERNEHEKSGPMPRRLATHERIEWRARLVHELAPLSPRLSSGTVTVHVDRHDAASLERSVRDLVDSARASLGAVAEELAGAELLPDAASATAKLRFRVEVVDLRSDRAKPLPVIEKVDGTEVGFR